MRNACFRIVFAAILLAGCDPAGLPQFTGTSAAPTGTAETITADNPAKWTGKVIGVTDGDTIDVLTDQKQVIRVRFNGIDTPERGQPFGNNAKQFVSDAVFGKPVTIVGHGIDRYDRTLGDVIHEDKSLNCDLVTAGLAWHYKAYSDDEQLAAAELKARAAGKGLWSDPRHVAPWDWRKLSKVERDELR